MPTVEVAKVAFETLPPDEQHHAQNGGNRVAGASTDLSTNPTGVTATQLAELRRARSRKRAK